MRGRKRKSEGELKSSGSRQKHEPTNAVPITSKKGSETAPEYFGQLQLETWGEIVPILKRMKMFTEADRHIVIQYCEDWAALRETVLILEEDGRYLTEKTREGNIHKVRHPALDDIGKLKLSIVRLSDRLGLNPKARESFTARAFVPDGNALPTMEGPPASSKKQSILAKIKDRKNGTGN